MYYTIKAYDIVGYAFQADTYCVDCTRDLAQAQTFAAGSATSWGDCGSAEDILAEWAGLLGIDRHDETSYDSDEFPKVVFASMVEGNERCGGCYEKLLDTV